MGRGLITFVSFVTLAALAVAAIVIPQYPVVPVGWDAWAGVVALLGIVLLAEGVGISTGRAAFTVSLIPIVTTVPLFGPSVALIVTAGSQMIARTVVRRQSGLKSVFNVSQLTLAIGLGSVVYVTLEGPIDYAYVERFELMRVVPGLMGLILTYFLVNMAMVSVVIALDSGKRVIDIWRKLGPVAFANDLASSSFSLFVVFAYAELGVGGLLVVLLPLFFLQHSYGLQHKLLTQNREILEFTIRTIEAKDPYTSGHSLRVAGVSRELAQALGMVSQKIEEVETAALLHDIGKIDFAYAELIGNPAQLTDTERDLIRSHPERGSRLLASLSSLGKDVILAVRHHHEHYDGNGYPDGLSGTDIPVAARIIMVADTVDAMLSDRPYRSALSVGDVADELRRLSGRQFDPHIVSKFLQLGILERAARRAELDRTPLPISGLQFGSRMSAS